MNVEYWTARQNLSTNPLNAELNPICHLLALLLHHILHISRIKVKPIHMNEALSILKLWCHWTSFSADSALNYSTKVQ